jgi:hypothetical protein
MIDKDTVVSLKLISGEEVCGIYISEDAQQITLGKPFRLIQNKEGFGFAPMMVTTDPTLPQTFFKYGIVIIATTFKGIAAQYESVIEQISEEKDEKDE